MRDYWAWSAVAKRTAELFGIGAALEYALAMFGANNISAPRRTIDVSGATLIENGIETSGNWSGVLAGPNGSEVAGIVFVEGGLVYHHHPLQATNVFRPAGKGFDPEARGKADTIGADVL